MKTKTMMCAVCSDQFETKSHRSKFCSNKCKQRDKYARLRDEYFTIHCAQCRVEIFTNDKRLKYCSVECRAIAKVIRSY